MRTTQPYRLLEIAKALASGEPRAMVVKRYAQQWKLSEQAIRSTIRLVNERWSTKTPTPPIEPPREVETIIKLSMLREAMRTGEPRREITSRFSKLWDMHPDSIDRLISRAMRLKHDEIEHELHAHRARWEFAKWKLLQDARDRGDCNAAVKLFSEMAKRHGLL